MGTEIDGVNGIIKNTTSDGDITIKGNDGGSEISAVAFDMSAAGAATFNNKIVATELDISGAIDVAGTANLDVVDIDGALTQDGGAVFNEASADVDFRVESNGLTHALFVDGGENHVGIGTNAPKELLHIEDAAPILRISDSNSTSEDDAVSKIQFFDRNNTDVCSEIISGTGSLADLIISNNNSRALLFQTNGNTERFRIGSAGTLSTGAETAPDVGAGGLTLQQNAIDTGILSFKSSDIAHGMTNVNETDTYGDFRKHNATEGGLQVRGTSESASPGFVIDGIVSTSSDNSNTGAEAPVHITGRKQNGTTTQVMGAANNLVAVRNSGDTKFIIKGDGEIFSDQSATVGTYDTYEDAQLVRSLELSRGSAMTGLINSQFDKYIKYNHETLAEANLVGREKDGTPNHFVNITGMQRLHNGAIWQQYETTQKLTQAMFELAKETLGEEKAKAILEKHEVKLLN